MLNKSRWMMEKEKAAPLLHYVTRNGTSERAAVPPPPLSVPATHSCVSLKLQRKPPPFRPQYALAEATEEQKSRTEGSSAEME